MESRMLGAIGLGGGTTHVHIRANGNATFGNRMRVGAEAAYAAGWACKTTPTTA